MFSEIITSTTTLKPGNSYTFTYDAGFVVGVLIGTVDYVRKGLQPYMKGLADIISVNHSFLSKKFTITIVPLFETSLSNWLDIFNQAWKGIGYTSTYFIQAETGSVSTTPGGTIEAVKGTTEFVGGAATDILKPVMPVLILGVAGLFAILLIKGK